MDKDGYPDDNELKKIEEWDFRNFPALMEYIYDLWAYKDSGYWKQEGNTYHISTAGWSGNESIVGALQENRMFWSCCWQQSKRGGHYIFKIVFPIEDECES